MDCRKFHKNLEDYLDDGLDFPGRFGMERHAQQCIRCGKAMSDAQRLRRMARDLERVKAPANFESQVLAEIGKDTGRLSALRRFWIYGFEFPSPRKLVLASSFLAIVTVGMIYMYPRWSGSNRKPSISASAPVAVSKEPAKIEQKEDAQPAAVAAVMIQPSSPLPAPVTTAAKLKEPSEPPITGLEQMVDREVAETDYVEFQVPGPDNRPVSIRWGNKPRIRNGQTFEEYYIRNVSH